MAIRVNSTTPFGINVDQAYCRVECVSITKSELSFTVRRYKDASGLPFFQEEWFSAPYALSSVNPIQQAYEHLKSLPEFDGATDVLEAGQPQ